MATVGPHDTSSILMPRHVRVDDFAASLLIKPNTRIPKHCSCSSYLSDLLFLHLIITENNHDGLSEEVHLATNRDQ